MDAVRRINHKADRRRDKSLGRLPSNHPFADVRAVRGWPGYHHKLLRARPQLRNSVAGQAGEGFRSVFRVNDEADTADESKSDKRESDTLEHVNPLNGAARCPYGLSQVTHLSVINAGRSLLAFRDAKGKTEATAFQTKSDQDKAVADQARAKNLIERGYANWKTSLVGLGRSAGR